MAKAKRSDPAQIPAKSEEFLETLPVFIGWLVYDNSAFPRSEADLLQEVRVAS
jgi:hypothetical protein